MKILNEAKEFAIIAHDGQVRKADSEKPVIVHPINVANMLKEYGFDEEVVAAGYLHDVIEDTKYTEADIKRLFGSNILSLVKCASEPDKKLSWEERKRHTIEFTKDLDIRHKAVICADKISNLEDIMILSEIRGELNFSDLKRGFNDQKWYFEGVYNSLIHNQDENHPMFIRLKKLIDHVFYNIKDDDYIKNVIFKDKLTEYNELNKLHYMKKDISKLGSIVSSKQPFVIEFTGTPRTGKTTLINDLYDFFKKGGFDVQLLEEFTTSKRFKEEVQPSFKDKSLLEINTEIPKQVELQLNNSLLINPDIVLIDRSLFDRLIWIDRLFVSNKITLKEYEAYKKTYIPLIKQKINIIIGTYADSLIAVKRDYSSNLSLEDRRFLNESNINEYNTSLLNMEQLSKDENINFNLFNTNSSSQREISFDVSRVILNDMRDNYINQVKRMVLRSKQPF